MSKERKTTVRKTKNGYTFTFSKKDGERLGRKIAEDGCTGQTLNNEIADIIEESKTGHLLNGIEHRAMPGRPTP